MNKRNTGKALVMGSIFALTLSICGEARAQDPAAARASVFKKFDTNRDGFMSFDEFIPACPLRNDLAATRARYDSFDTNKDGTLTEQEMVNAGKTN